MTTITLSQLPDSNFVEIVYHQTTANFVRTMLGHVHDVGLAPGGSDGSDIVVIIGAPDGVEDFVFDTELVDQVVKAILAGTSAKVIDNVNDRTFYAGAIGMRMVKANTSHELSDLLHPGRVTHHRHIPLPAGPSSQG